MSSLFIARDQENLVHTHQQTAASKPLNQGLKQLPPKTPGQTPFRRGLNNENNPGLFTGKGAFKNGGGLGGGAGGGENTVLRTGKTGKQDLITPMVPKTKDRAPLGMKTTNAKARAFQTPGQQPQQKQPTAKPLNNINGTNRINRSLRRPTSLKKKQTPPVKPPQQELQPHQTIQNEVKHQIRPSLMEDIPEPEYAPPTPEALPDPPEPIPYDRTFPQFQGRNFSHRWELLYVDPEEEERKQQAKYDEFDREMDRKFEESLDVPLIESDGLGEVIPGLNKKKQKEEVMTKDEPEVKEKKKKDTKRKKGEKSNDGDGDVRTGSRMVTRSMARRLALQQQQQQQQQEPVTASQPSTSSPTTSSYTKPSTSRSSSSTTTTTNTALPKPRSRSSSRLMSTKYLDLNSLTYNASTPEEIEARHAQAVAGSRTTVGYSKGRSVSTRLFKMKSTEGQIESKKGFAADVSTGVKSGGGMKLKSVKSVSFSAVNRPKGVSLMEMFGSPPEGGVESVVVDDDDEEEEEGEGEDSDDSYDTTDDDDDDDETDDDDEIDGYVVDDDADADEDGIDIKELLKESESDAEFQLTL